MIEISLGTHRSTRENTECTSECCGTNQGITNTLWEMPEFLWIFIRRMADDILDGPDAARPTISLNA